MASESNDQNDCTVAIETRHAGTYNNIPLLQVIMRSAEEKTVLLCALDGDVEGLKRLLESNSATDSKQPENILWEKDEVGRNALFAACTLGRSGILSELVQNGADVKEFTARGRLISESFFVKKVNL